MEEENQNLSQNPQGQAPIQPATNPKPSASRSASSAKSADTIPLTEILTSPTDPASNSDQHEPEMTMKPRPPSSVSADQRSTPAPTGAKISTASGQIVLHSTDARTVTTQPDPIGIEFDDRPDGPRKGLFVFIVIVAIALLGSAGYFGYRLANRKTASTAQSSSAASIASINYRVLSEKTDKLGNLSYDFYIPSTKVSYENINKMIKAEISNQIDRKRLITINIYDDEDAYAQITELSGQDVSKSAELQAQQKSALSHLVATAQSTDWRMVSSGIYKSLLDGKEIKF